jgi:hypothetical protein
MVLFGRRVSWPLLVICVVALLGAAAVVGSVGFGVAPLLVLGGGFCGLMMGSMLWMLVGMAKHTTVRRH